ncbi:MAG: Na(+)/H(+) antiporter subunit B [Proteobacteria bacterium]|nr:Na(+)/H(+) antiporter subunit B [Pseudomonadota bacterium]
MEHHLVLRVVARTLIPLIMLFALYVQFHGDYGPGGGFQAGVIFAVAFILYGLIYGVDKLRDVVHPGLIRSLAAFGVLLYVGVGIASIIGGGEFLNYNALATDPVAGQHIGIILIELGVGITVASTMIILFYAFARP